MKVLSPNLIRPLFEPNIRSGCQNLLRGEKKNDSGHRPISDRLNVILVNGKFASSPDYFFLVNQFSVSYSVVAVVVTGAT